MAFRFAYSGLFWQTPDLERELPDVRQHGFEGWEMRLPLDWVGSAARVGRLCQQAGVEVAAVCGPNVTLDLDHPNQEICKRRMEFAADLGVETFMTKGPGRGDLAGAAPDGELDRMAAVYEDLAVYGQRLGVVVTFHPHIRHLVDSWEEWQRFMGRLEHCRLCMDMSHSVHWGRDPVLAARGFAAAIAYVHLHDFKDGRTVELGRGPMCDYQAFLAALTEIGYRGWVTVCPGEEEGTEREKMRVNREFLRSIGY